jgi:hypothetical protein
MFMSGLQVLHLLSIMRNGLPCDPDVFGLVDLV